MTRAFEMRLQRAAAIGKLIANLPLNESFRTT